MTDSRQIDESRTLPSWAWPALSALAALLAIPGVFTLTRVFYYRDLSSYFWPRDLWFRRMLASGHFPIWDPAAGYGYPTAADPVMQTFFPPALVLRLLPEVIGFNLLVALPFPVAALGTYLFARRRWSRPASAACAIAFAASGPMLSTANFPNVAWACAMLPWVLLAVDRFVERATAGRFGALSAAFALSMLAGEPVTFAGTAALAPAYAALGSGVTGPRFRWRPAALVCASVVVGVLLSAVQFLPLVDQTLRSKRGEFNDRDWSVHPVRLVEAVVPWAWGSSLDPVELESPWLLPLNSGRDPWYDSLYFGTGAVALCLLGALGLLRCRWSRFWVIVLVVSLVFALGDNTPIYPAVRLAVPLLKLFRFPAKYLIFSAISLGALVAAGWDALADVAVWRKRAVRVAGLVLVTGITGALASVVALISPAVLADHGAALATRMGIADPAAAGAYVASTAFGTGARLAAFALVTGGLIALAAVSRKRAPLARGALLAVLAIDLVATNGSINPTIEVELLEPGPWAAEVLRHPESRVFIEPTYIKGKLRYAVPDGVGLAIVAARTTSIFRSYPSAWGIREALGIDHTLLGPREHAILANTFVASSQSARELFLRRTGVRYFLLAEPPESEMRQIAVVPGFEPVALYEDPQPGPRVLVARREIVDRDIGAQLRTLFRTDFDPFEAVGLLEPPPEPAGMVGTGEEPSARILREEPTEIEIEAAAPEGGGYLLLLDAYDPHWRAEVDGQPVAVLRADGFFRAVRLAPGRHHVRIHYAPRWLWIGTAISVTAALVLAIAALLTRRRDRAAAHVA